MRKLLIATRSKGKFPEITSLLHDLDSYEFLNLNDINDLPKDFEVEETAMTFAGNAIIKAKTIGELTGLLTMADDSGLEVDALDGRPGVKTARYAPGSDQDRYEKLLQELKGVPEEQRTARFVCVIAIYDPETKSVRTCQGIYKGKIAFEPRGSNGFGYDPVFYNEGLKKMNAEMTLDEKNEVSHRGAAVREAKLILKTNYQ